MSKKDELNLNEEYKYGFKDADSSVFKTAKGLNEEIVIQISKMKHEPDWMKEYRLKSLKAFCNMPNPNFGVDLSYLDYDSYTYFIRPSQKEAQSWELSLIHI